MNFLQCKAMVNDKIKLKKKHRTVRSMNDGNLRRPKKHVDNRGGHWTTGNTTRKQAGVVSESPKKRGGEGDVSSARSAKTAKTWPNHGSKSPGKKREGSKSRGRQHNTPSPTK